MAAPSVTYTFSNSTTADATQVNTNFNDLINGASDGTSDYTINVLTAAGTATFNGNVVLGNASGDTITVNGQFASNLVPSSNGTRTLGTVTNAFKAVYLDNTSTDGGAIYFDLGTTEFLKSSADGTRLDTGGFTSVRLDGAALEVYSTTTKAKISTAGVASYMGAMTPGWMSNLGLAAATTSETADSIVIQGTAATLSTSNPLHVTVQSTTSGLLTTLTATSDVTIDLTGAHWAFGTIGDLVDQPLYVYAINDTAAIKWGVSATPGLTRILNTDSSATGSSVNAFGDMLVNSALNSGTWPCEQVGDFLAAFDDTGGASEDLWVVQTGTDEIHVGKRILTWISARYETDTTSAIADDTWTTINYEDRVTDTFNAVTTGGNGAWVFTAPKAGPYILTCSASLEADAGWAAGETFGLRFVTDPAGSPVTYGVYFHEFNASLTAVAIPSGSITLHFAKGDTVQLQIYQNSGGSIDLSGSPIFNWVSVSYCGH